ncbi:MAG: hypothetical protein JW881_19655, partial [Spirochaetales bacterium]|nr:hypothetical protein [Spirochaetales bacterium]
MIDRGIYTTLPIRNPWPGAPVLYRKMTSSTQDDARRLVAGEGRSRVTGEGRSRVTGEGRSRVTGE